MSCNSMLRQTTVQIWKTDEISFLFFFLFNLAIVSSISTDYPVQQNRQLSVIENDSVTYLYEERKTSSSGKRPEATESSYNNNRIRGAGYYYYQRPALIASSSSTTLGPTTANNRPVRRNPYVSDTCGGIVNIPLSFHRLLPYKSTHFPSRRDYPLVCTWNFTVKHENCRRARVTMRLDGRSRLPDVDGCRKGYYTVSPNMKGTRICGRIGDVPAFQWYVDAHSPGNNVTVVTMKSLGINDGYNEGLSFTLQGECVDNELPRRMKIEKENVRLNRRWMNRVIEDFLVGEGPRIVIKSHPKVPVTSTSRPVTISSQPDPPAATTLSLHDSNDHHYTGIQWLTLKSPSDPTLSPEITENFANDKAVENETIIQGMIPLQLEYPATTSSVSSTTTGPDETTNETNPFSLTISTPIVMETASNDVLSTASSTTSPTTTPSSSSEIKTTLEQLALSHVASTTSPSVQNDVDDDVPQISGYQFIFGLLQKTLQRTFLKFLKLFS